MNITLGDFFANSAALAQAPRKHLARGPSLHATTWGVESDRHLYNNQLKLADSFGPKLAGLSRYE